MRAPTACKRTVSGSISLPCSGCFPPFPHGTGSLSVFRECLALRDGPRRFGQDSTCPALLRCHLRFIAVTRTGLSPSTAALSKTFWFPDKSLLVVLRFRLCPFRSPLLRVSTFLSFPPGTKMFQFPGFALPHGSTWSSTMWVAPFRDARIKTCLQFPEPFRSLPRLSSPLDSLGILRSLFVPFSCTLPGP